MLYRDETGWGDSGGNGEESFIQRQKRLAGQRARQQAQPQGDQPQLEIMRENPQFQPRTQVPGEASGNLADKFGAGSADLRSSIMGQPQSKAAPQQQPQQQAAPQAPPPQPATPVTGGGKIPEPQPLPAPQPYAPVSTGQPTQLQPGQLGNAPFKTYQGVQFQTQAPQAGVLPGTYQGTQFAQFTAPQTADVEGQQRQLLSAILGAPGTVNPTLLKEREKEANLTLADQARQLAASRNASRGMTNGSAFAGDLANIDSSLIDRVITGNRDIDIAAAGQNRQDQLAALGASENILSGQMGRASQAFGNILAGQGAQAQDSRAVSQDALARAIAGDESAFRRAGFDLNREQLQAGENFQQFQTERSAQDAALQRELANFGMAKDVAGIDLANRGEARADAALGLQKALGLGGMDLDRWRAGESGRQFDTQQAMNLVQFLEQQRQHNNNLGFNYNQLEQSGQQGLMQLVMNMLGRG